jgi:hypothetical protein
MDKSLDEVGLDSILAPPLVIRISTRFDNRSFLPSPEAFVVAALVALPVPKS